MTRRTRAELFVRLAAFAVLAGAPVVMVAATGLPDLVPIALLASLPALALGVGYTVMRLGLAGLSMHSATATVDRVKLVRLGRVSEFTVRDSVIVLQKLGGQHGIKTHGEEYRDAGVRIAAVLCRDDGKLARLTFDDWRDPGLADLLARWMAGWEREGTV